MTGSGASQTQLRRLSGRLLVGLALSVLAIAYGAMGWEHGTPFLWNVVVHEDGHRTLAQTLFYFEHATRELPIDLLLGIAVGAGGAAALASPECASRRASIVIPAALLACILLMTVATAAQLGLDALRDNLLQYHTREGAPLTWGAHWRYHLLERGPMMLLALGLWMAVGAFRPEGGYARSGLAGWMSLVAYIALTVLFTRELQALALPFTDARFLGHQIREIFTHGLVTLPLTLGLILLHPGREIHFAPRPDARLVWSIVPTGAAAAIFVYVLLAALAADAASQGLSESLITLLAPHFYEHGFTYLVTPLTAMLVFQRLGAASPSRRAPALFASSASGAT